MVADVSRQQSSAELRRARLDAINAAGEASRLAEALRAALDALEAYARDDVWLENGFGYYEFRPKGLHPTKVARGAIKSIERIMDENYVPKALREEQDD